MDAKPAPPLPRAHLELPFFDAAHRQLAEALAEWLPTQTVDEGDDRRACHEWVRRLALGSWLRYAVPASHGGVAARIDSRSLVLLREALAFHSPLADFAFAMQGLGSGAISLAGSATQRGAYLPAVAQGEKIAAFALSEPDAGSDVSAIATHAEPLADGGWRLHGSKTWISNGGLADFYCVFARTGPGEGSRGLSAFIVDAGTPGLSDREHIELMAPHPLATLRFTDCRLPPGALLGSMGDGFRLAMQTLDIFRASVAAAALGMARRALAEAREHARRRRMFGGVLADLQLTQARLGEMATAIDEGALLTYRAAWQRDMALDEGGDWKRRSVAAAMAKMSATEHAQRVIDMALQMHGGLGVQRGQVVEHLYRDIRALRIYEGATEVQQLIIGKAVLQE